MSKGEYDNMVTTTQTSPSKLAEAQSMRDGAAKILGELTDSIEARGKELKQVITELDKTYPYGDNSPETLMDRRDALLTLIRRLRERITHAERTLALEQSRLDQITHTVSVIRGEIQGYERGLDGYRIKRQRIEGQLQGTPVHLRRPVEAQISQLDREVEATQLRLQGAKGRLQEIIGEEAAQ